jgi:uncharacterized membrane protein
MTLERSMAIRKPLWLITIAIPWALILIALTFTGFGDTAFLAVLALPFVFVLPGYTFLAATFPKRAFGVMDIILYSIGGSLAIVILGGLLLNLTPFGLEARSWSALLGGFVICASIVAFVRQRRGTEPSGESSERLAFAVRSLATVAPRAWLLYGLAAAITIGSIVANTISAKQQETAQGYTDLWILPADSADQKRAVVLGVNNMQPTTMSYTLVVSVNGKEARRWETITLQPRQRWQATLALSSGGGASGGGGERVEAALYRSSAPSAPYRHVTLWLGP